MPFAIFNAFVVVNGAEQLVEIDGDESGERLLGSGNCSCGEPLTQVERRGYCGEKAFAVCESCPNEYPIQFRKEGK